MKFPEHRTKHEVKIDLIKSELPMGLRDEEDDILFDDDDDETSLTINEYVEEEEVFALTMVKSIYENKQTLIGTDTGLEKTEQEKDYEVIKLSILKLINLCAEYFNQNELEEQRLKMIEVLFTVNASLIRDDSLLKMSGPRTDVLRNFLEAYEPIMLQKREKHIQEMRTLHKQRNKYRLNSKENKH